MSTQNKVGFYRVKKQSLMHFQTVRDLQVLGDIHRHPSRIPSRAACFILDALTLTSSLIQKRLVTKMLKGLETLSYKFELNK